MAEAHEAPIVIFPNGNSAWKLLMQSGVGFRCTVGQPVCDFLRNDLDLSEEQIRKIESVLIDGMPVDDPTTSILPDGCRLALAAGLPGAAGLAMRMDSGVKALRPGITYLRKDVSDPRPGMITLLLYALVLPILAPLVLSRGVLATYGQIKRYSRFAPDDLCVFQDREMTVTRFLEEEAYRDEGDSITIIIR